RSCTASDTSRAKSSESDTTRTFSDRKTKHALDGAPIEMRRYPMKHRLHKPSPALVVAAIALFVSLVGTSYAAVALPRNSVGTAQLKDNAVTSAKLANRAVTVIKLAGKLSQATLASGKTERGEYGMGAEAASDVMTEISFPLPLASAPTLNIINSGDSLPA